MPRPPRFTIRAASALAGINPNTLRAWERRYGLLRPERTPKGYRLYSEEDIRVLRRIRRAMAKGIPVGRVRDHLDDLPNEDDTLLPDSTTAPAPHRRRAVQVSLAEAGLPGSATIVLPEKPDRPGGASLEEWSQRIEEAALRFDRPALERAFSGAVGTHSLRDAFESALAPAIRRLGEQYLRRLDGIAEEHFLSAFARERLLAALAGLRPLHQQPRLVCACAPGEQHELGLMLLALEFGLDGVSTVYLGANVPPLAVAHAATSARLRAVVMSCTLAVPHAELRELRRRLDDSGHDVRVFVGGPAVPAHADMLRESGLEPLPGPVREAARQVLAAIPRG